MIDEYDNIKFSIRKGDFEVRISHNNLFDKNKLTPELLNWSTTDNMQEYCFSLATWHYDPKEPCWEMKAVGDRMFTEIPHDKLLEIWDMCATLDHFLNS